VGTERIEEELHGLFPGLRVLRMDYDTTRRKGAHDRILTVFAEGQADVLLGTQMVAKGLDFPRVTLVGVIDADVGLNLPDFRAGERTFQLLTQVSGRTGRGPLGGEVFVQTYSPQHPSVLLAGGHDYMAFAENELKSREELRYPPFSRLISVLVQGKEAAHVERHSLRLAEEIRKCVDTKHHLDVEVLGPAPAPLGRIKDQYRWKIIIKSQQIRPVGMCIREACQSVQNDRSAGQVRIIADVDPVDML
jgi:primosomal protein N' (replication factor Y)